MRHLLLLTLFLTSLFSFGQTNWKKDTTQIFNQNDTSKIWRSGSVAISHKFKSPFVSKLFVTDKYKEKNNRGFYLSLNEPNLTKNPNDTTDIGLEKDTSASHIGMVVSQYTNFKSNTLFKDTHTSSAEFIFNRGTSDSLGFRDGGTLAKSAAVKISSGFANNNRAYKNTEMDLLNLRFFTGASPNNLAKIDNFYAIRLEDFRGVNPGIITKGWGIYMKPAILNNFFGGNVGIGTENVTHKLTIEATANPLKIGGLGNDANSNSILTVNTTGEVSKKTFTANVLNQLGQSNWKIDTTQEYSNAENNRVWRSGSVAISHYFKTPSNSKLLVTDGYTSKFNKAMYVSLNEPPKVFNLNDTTSVSLESDTAASHSAFIANHYANFKSGLQFKDVHNSTSEFNFFRGIRDQAGFKDGGDLYKSSVLKLAVNQAFNGRAYRTREMDVINMRLFTSDTLNNPAIIDNFYAIRMEDFRGKNPSIIVKGWGVYMKPAILKNFFGGNVGIGTENVTHKLTIEATSNPLKVTGLAVDTTAASFLTINNAGEVSKRSLSTLKSTQTFFISNTSNDVFVNNNFEIYIHKGGNANYILPNPISNPGQSLRIVNVGSGVIQLNFFFKQGSDKRCTIIPNIGAHSFTLFSDGIEYISLD
jgi:hypothetical protein